MCPEQYLTRWYTNYMKDLWTYEDLRTFYAGVREMTGPRHVRPDSFGTNEKHQVSVWRLPGRKVTLVYSPPRTTLHTTLNLNKSREALRQRKLRRSVVMSTTAWALSSRRQRLAP